MLLPVVNSSQQSKLPDGKVSVSDVTAEVKRYSVLSARVNDAVPPAGVDKAGAAPMTCRVMSFPLASFISKMHLSPVVV